MLYLLLLLNFSHAEIKSIKPLEFKNPAIKKNRKPAAYELSKKVHSFKLQTKNFNVEGFGEAGKPKEKK